MPYLLTPSVLRIEEFMSSFSACPFYDSGRCRAKPTSFSCQGHRLNFGIRDQTHSCGNVIELIKQYVTEQKYDELNDFLTCNSSSLRAIARSVIKKLDSGDSHGKDT